MTDQPVPAADLERTQAVLIAVHDHPDLPPELTNLVFEEIERLAAVLRLIDGPGCGSGGESAGAMDPTGLPPEHGSSDE